MHRQPIYQNFEWYLYDGSELFNSENATVIGADINEISTSPDTNLTEFSAALIAKKIVCCHINTKLNS